MMRHRAWLVIVAVGITLVACSPAAAPSGSASPGTLVITQSGSEEGGLYVEGAIAYVDVVDQGGRVVAELEDVDISVTWSLARSGCRRVATLSAVTCGRASATAASWTRPPTAAI
jgi:hypothetical protein